MENFIVSARKYRPAAFDTVVGQLNITSTLKNAIRNKQLAQAFLFCGPRGVGKTTCARILAKTINCFNPSANIEACDQCDSCKSFIEGHSLNIYELDAASNNSVDDIRNLITQVSYAPQIGTKKVYIIDEVHMLSQAAFNAFLKTLEEPPRHALFILATTEKHKIIPTILSRCQIFDFARIGVDDIANHLEMIAKKENITAEQDALHIIAQKADGALRDALSIFDQMAVFSGNNITYKAVIENLNVLDYDYYFKVTECVLNSKIPDALLIFNEILNNGFDGHNFMTGLSAHFRNLLVCKDMATLQLLEVGKNIREKYKEQSALCPQLFLLRGLSLLNKADINYKNSRNQRLLVELTLMQLCSLQNVQNEGEKKSPIISAPIKNYTLKAVVSKVEEPQPEINAQAVKREESVKEVQSRPVAISSGEPEIKKSFSSRPSMKSIMNGNGETTAKQEEQIISPQLPKNTFTKEQLLEAWHRYAAKMKDTHKMNLFTTMNLREPHVNENFTIEFEIDNKVQEEQLLTEKTDLLGFLRGELQNSDIGLSLIITQKTEGKKLYTSQEKFKHLAEKNPSLLKLKQQFDLDIDY